MSKLRGSIAYAMAIFVSLIVVYGAIFCFSLRFGAVSYIVGFCCAAVVLFFGGIIVRYCVYTVKDSRNNGKEFKYE